MDEMIHGDHAEHMTAIGLVDPDQATHIAIASGDWFDPAIWDGGVVPSSQAKVYIPEGVSVTYGGLSDVPVFSLGVAGELRFDQNADSKLIVDTLVVVPTGRLEIGTLDNPIPHDVSCLLYTSPSPRDA